MTLIAASLLWHCNRYYYGHRCSELAVLYTVGFVFLTLLLLVPLGAISEEGSKTRKQDYAQHHTPS